MATIHAQAEVPESWAGKRLDQAAAALFPAYSRARLQAWIRDGSLRVDGEQRRPRDPVDIGQQLELTADGEGEAATHWTPKAGSLDLVYEDEHVIVLNKAAGVVVHPAAGHHDDTLVNALLHHCPKLAELPRAGIVHRLDKDTTGLMMVAKTLPAHTGLVRSLQARDVQREYEAVVQELMISGGTVDAPIGRHPVQRKKMAVVDHGKPSVTHYRVLERFRAHTRILCRLETGRTHQIRVHMAHIRHPLLGDPVYGSRMRVPSRASQELIEQLRKFRRQALHARCLGFLHPVSGGELEFRVEVPEDMQQLVKALREDTEQGGV